MIMCVTFFIINNLDTRVWPLLCLGPRKAENLCSSLAQRAPRLWCHFEKLKLLMLAKAKGLHITIHEAEFVQSNAFSVFYSFNMVLSKSSPSGDTYDRRAEEGTGDERRGEEGKGDERRGEEGTGEREARRGQGRNREENREQTWL